MIYKYLSGALAILLLIAAGFYGYERYTHKRDKRQMLNEISKLEGTVQETESAYSRRAIEIEDLKAKSDELQEIIEARDEQILALSQASLRWKTKYFKMANATQTVVTSDPSEPTECAVQDGCPSVRMRVDFEQEQDPIRVSGYTLTSPPYAEVAVEWIRPLNLEIILTKNDIDGLRLYVNPENSDVETAELQLFIDPSVMERAWYENIAFGVDVAAGSGAFQADVRVHYDFLANLYAGVMVVFQVDYTGVPRVFGGASIGWYPFRN